MTQEQIEQTRVIAEKDGLELHIPANPDYAPYWKRYDSDGLIRAEYPTDKLPYLTDLNALHKVAMDVMEELRGFVTSRDAVTLAATIMATVCLRSINGQYIDLFNAVYEGIVYLQNQEK